MSVVTLFPFPGGGGGATDPYFDDVLLLIGANGTDGSTSFTDESSYARLLTTVGNAQVDIAQSKFDGGSLLLDGSGDYVSAPYSTDWRIQANTPFTMEAWVRFADTSGGKAILGIADASAINFTWLFYVSGANELRFWYYTSTTLTSVAGPFTRSADQWYHLAVDRDASNVLRVYVDGVVVGSATNGNQSNNQINRVLRVGSAEEHTFDLNGHLDEVRITQNVARYGGAFTPPTERFPRS